MNISKLNRKKLIGLAISLLIIVSVITSVLIILLRIPDNQVIFVEGPLTEDTSWSGLVHVSGSVFIPINVTLTILPGTTVEFEHYRGYKEHAIVGFNIVGGTVIAIGTPENQIWFTSDAEDPLNGDWAGISCSLSNDTIFKYAIVEYSNIGIEQIKSSIEISHSIIRWVNTEGLYAEESSPLIEYNLIYANAYHDIALEQHNYDVQIRYNIFNGGHYSIHSEATNVTIEGNYFVNYTKSAITGGQFSNISIISNKFENITESPTLFDSTTTIFTLNNDFGNASVPIPQLDFPDSKRSDLGYIPGDPEDKYLYVYPDSDETRKIIRRLNNEQTIGAALTFMNGSLWRFNLALYEKGTLQSFVKIDPITGNFTTYGNNFIVNPRGLANDGTFFWVNDFTLRKIFKFKINSSDVIEILDSFDVPYSSEGGLVSLACDGTFLYSLSRNGATMYKIDMTGTLVSEIIFLGASIWGAITWTGMYFWAFSDLHLTRWYSNWTLAGKIYPAAWGTDALAWDGTYLWALSRTCEIWADGKIFQIEIIDDQVLF
ncbi:MAG: right-handed parallel beta-helix repeat-containing protein [Candidatus Heimdallarchaeaceae archaeon]|jgi:hypothetical protein